MDARAGKTLRTHISKLFAIKQRPTQRQCQCFVRNVTKKISELANIRKSGVVMSIAFYDTNTVVWYRMS
jgi:hypothetical protein